MEKGQQGGFFGYTTKQTAKALRWSTKRSGKWCAAAVTKALHLHRLPELGMAWPVTLPIEGTEPQRTYQAWTISPSGLEHLRKVYRHIEEGHEFEIVYNGKRNILIKKPIIY